MSTRRQWLKASARLAGGVSFLGIAGCQTEPADQSSASKTNFYCGVTALPRMLDPRKATDALSSRINRLLYQSLIDFDDHFQPIPSLASWQKLSPTHYRFTLQNARPFHHGRLLTAKDVVATYRSILDKSLGSPHYGSLKHIDKVVAIDDQQVDFILKRPDALFVGRLTIGICPADLVAAQHPFQTQPIGSGRAQFIAQDAQKVQLQRLNDLKFLTFIPVKDATVRVLKLRKGELDWIQNDLSPELVNYCERRQDLTVHWHRGTNFNYIGYNFEDPALAQLEIRQAIAHGIDRQAIIQALFQGHARLAGGLLVPEHWAGNPQLHGFDYQPQKARQLLQQGLQKIAKNAKIPSPVLFESPENTKKDENAQAGLGILAKKSKNDRALPPVLLTLSYKTSSNPTSVRLATIYQSQLRQIGIQLKIQSYDWGTFYHDIKKGRFQLYSLAWVGIKSPDIFKYVFDSQAIPPNGANRGRYRDALADRLIRQAEQETDLKKAAELYRQLQAHLQQTLACLPLWYDDQYAVTRPEITGYQLFADGRYDGLLNLESNYSA